jgi:hypothetical protein
MRHPQFKPLQWSHHQKFVVIDDKHAFAGGVDFSTGRFDWHEHHVVDPEAKYWWGIVSLANKEQLAAISNGRNRTSMRRKSRRPIKQLTPIKLSWTSLTSRACPGTTFRCTSTALLHEIWLGTLSSAGTIIRRPLKSTRRKKSIPS